MNRDICKHCGVITSPPQYRYCTPKCALLANIAKDGDCWVWTLSTVRGYGQLSLYDPQRKRAVHVLAHRTSHEVFKGPIPEGMHVLHSCDRPACINPDHLSVGSNRDNRLDAVAKDRHQRGTRHYNTELTDDDVRLIRRSPEKASAIARRFGVQKNCIYKIRTRHTWKHVEDAVQ